MEILNAIIRAIDDRPAMLGKTVAAWNTTALTSIIDRASRPIVITEAAASPPPTLLGFRLIEDKILPPGVVEVRDVIGNVIQRLQFEV